MGEALRRDRKVSDADMIVLCSDASRIRNEAEQIHPAAASFGGGSAVTFPEFLIRSTLQAWLRFGGVQVQPIRKGKLWSLTLSSGICSSTFGAIAVQLLLDIIGTPTLTICKSCSILFAPTRRVDRNRDQFCGSKNCRREAWRLSKEARRRGRTPLWTRPDLAERNRRHSPKLVPETGK
jgi:hypothetical protein